MLTHWSGPTVLAVLLALLSLPLVAISLDADSGAPCGGGLFSGRTCIYDGLPLANLGRWAAAAGAVLTAALVAGTIGGMVVRRHAVTGGILTVLLAWEVAVAALPWLPSLLDLDVGFGFNGSFGAQIQSSHPSSGLGVALLIPLLPLEWCREPVPFVLLLAGVVAWTVILRRFPVSRDTGE
jgi:ABC-type branched-subunit amino acid transport system permease subunit